MALMAVALVVIVLGARFLRRGIVGKRVGDQPFCRRCGFDLSGRQLTERCPECGADLDARREVVVGLRHRRWVSLAFGLLFCAVGLIPLWFILSGQVQNLNLDEHKPVYWLVHEATVADPKSENVALRQLSWRMKAGKLSKAQISTIVDRGLKFQRDPTRPWNVAWGDFIEDARDAKLVSDEQWKTYAQQAASTQWLTFSTRQRLHPGETATATLTAGNARVGRSPRFLCELREMGIVVDGKEYPRQTSAASSQPGAAGKLMTLDALTHDAVPGESNELNAALLTLPPGEHKGYYRVQATVKESPAAAAAAGAAIATAADPTIQYRVRSMYSGNPLVNPQTPTPQFGSFPAQTPSPQSPFIRLPPLPPPDISDPKMVEKLMAARRAAILQQQRAAVRALRSPVEAMHAGEESIAASAAPTGADIELQLPVKFEVVEPGKPVAIAVNDEKFRPAVQRSLGVYMVELNGQQAAVQLQSDGPPIDLSYNVLLREGEKEWPIGNVAIRAHQTMGVPAVIGQLPANEAPAGQTVDVVFRPDGGSAGAPVGMEQFWNGQIVVKHVLLRDTDRAARNLRRDRKDVAMLQQSAATEAVFSTGVPVTATSDLKEKITQLQKMQLEVRDKLLAVPADDWARYQDFLKNPDTGLIRLLPREKYEDTVVGMREAGAYYSFLRKTHEYNYGSDIELNEFSRFRVGFAGSDYGYFWSVGDVPIEKVPASLEQTPEWAREKGLSGWTAMWREVPIESGAFQGQMLLGAPGLRDVNSQPGVSADVGRTYLLRSVSSDSDLLVALRVIRKFDDGSVALAYRILKRFESTDRNGRPRVPRKLPTTRVP
jgi:hypothetical protein